MAISYILRIITLGVSSFYFYLLVCCFVPVKNNKWLEVIAFVGISYVCNVIIYNTDIFNISYSIIIFVCIMLICFEGHPIKKSSIVMVLFPIVVALNFITREIAVQVYFAFNQSAFIDFVIVPIIKSTVCIAWYVIFKVFKNRIQKPYLFIDNKSWLLIDIICLAPLISIFSVIIYTPFGKQYQVYFIAFACIITSLGMILLIEYIVNSVKVHMENNNLRLEYSYYKELEESQLETRKMRHDMNNHLSIINSFIMDENLPEARNYLHSLSDKFHVSNREFCKNSIVNAVINTKYNLASKNEIDCFFNIDINSIIPIDDIDLCSIFANTLDNAVEASQKITDPSKRKITVKARCDKGYFSYCIVNHIYAYITVSKGIYLTDKPDQKMHGYGIENVRDIVKKYNGIMEISHTENEFSVLIAIRIE